jgi:plasmid stabilization system protein ParE
MENYSLKITDPAWGDIEGIEQYIAQQLKSPDAALNAARKIVIGLNVLENHPFTGVNLDIRLGRKLNDDYVTCVIPIG